MSLECGDAGSSSGSGSDDAAEFTQDVDGDDDHAGGGVGDKDDALFAWAPRAGDAVELRGRVCVVVDIDDARGTADVRDMHDWDALRRDVEFDVPLGDLQMTGRRGIATACDRIRRDAVGALVQISPAQGAHYHARVQNAYCPAFDACCNVVVAPLFDGASLLYDDPQRKTERVEAVHRLDAAELATLETRLGERTLRVHYCIGSDGAPEVTRIAPPLDLSLYSIELTSSGESHYSAVVRRKVGGAWRVAATTQRDAERSLEFAWETARVDVWTRYDANVPLDERRLEIAHMHLPASVPRVAFAFSDLASCAPGYAGDTRDAAPNAFHVFYRGACIERIVYCTEARTMHDVACVQHALPAPGCIVASGSGASLGIAGAGVVVAYSPGIRVSGGDGAFDASLLTAAETAGIVTAADAPPLERHASVACARSTVWPDEAPGHVMLALLDDSPGGASPAWLRTSACTLLDSGDEAGKACTDAALHRIGMALHARARPETTTECRRTCATASWLVCEAMRTGNGGVAQAVRGLEADLRRVAMRVAALERAAEPLAKRARLT